MSDDRISRQHSEDIKNTIWLTRPDLRQVLEGDRTRFEKWLLFEGVYEYRGLAESGDFHRILADSAFAASPETSPLLTRFMMLIWSTRTDLQQTFDLKTLESQNRFVCWCFTHGVTELKGRYFFTAAQWRMLHEPDPQAANGGFTPVTRLMREVWRSRPDLQQAFNLKNPDGCESFLRWYFTHGMDEFGFTHLVSDLQTQALRSPDPSIPQISRILGLVWASDADVQARFPDPAKEAFQQWAHCDEGQKKFSILQRISQSANPPPLAPSIHRAPANLPFGVNLIGYARSHLGIGEDVRMAARAMRAVGIPFSIYNVDPGPDVCQGDERAVMHFAETLPYAINLFCLTGMETARLAAIEGSRLFDGRRSIGYWPWELPEWPADWRHAYHLVDEIWASSHYTEEAYRRSSPKPVRYLPMAVTVDQTAGLTRDHFHLPKDRFLFIFSFDCLSSLARKNPQACVQAFQRAFPKGSEPAGLVIKTMRAMLDHPQWQALIAEVQADERIIVISKTLERAELLDLYRACDCFVSLHRSEGFGRSIVEAMMLGKPVIVTGYSGNMDFTLQEAAIQVRYRLQPLGVEDYPFGAGQTWAEPDVEHAAGWMRQIAADRALRQRLALAGQQLTTMTYAPTAVGAAYAKALNIAYQCEDIDSLPCHPKVIFTGISPASRCSGDLEPATQSADRRLLNQEAVGDAGLLLEQLSTHLSSDLLWFWTCVNEHDPRGRLTETSPLNLHQQREASISDFMWFIAHKQGKFDLTLDGEQGRLLEWYINDFREQWTHGAFPVSAKLRAYLQAPALADGLSSQPVSRLLFLFWKHHFNDKKLLLDREAHRYLLYRLISSPNAGTASFLRICGGLLNPLQLRHPQSSQLPIALNWYWHYAFSEEFQSSNLEEIQLLDYISATFRKLFYCLASGNHLALIPDDWFQFWRRLDASGLSLAERLIHAILHSGRLEPKMATLEWLTDDFYQHYPQFKILSPHLTERVTAKTAITQALIAIDAKKSLENRLYIVGHTTQTGLGANLWMSVAAFGEARIKPVVASVDQSPMQQIAFDQTAIREATVIDRAVVLFHVNSDLVPYTLARLPDSLQQQAYRIGFFLWETSAPPETHRLSLDLMDEIWVPSEYVAEIYRRYTATPVINVGKGLKAPESVVPLDRQLLGVRTDDFIFLMMGDFDSSIPRKHPLAVIQAFHQAFPEQDNIKLILKIRNIDFNHWSNRGGYWQKVEHEINDDPRILIIDQELSQADYWSLIKTCDALVSLHKSEGFGYGIAHAMLLEKPVIVSNYSGPQDFCTEDTAFLVPVCEVPVDRYEMPIAVSGALWGEPDCSTAAKLMREVVLDVDQRLKKAQAGYQRMMLDYCIEKLSNKYLSRIFKITESHSFDK